MLVPLRIHFLLVEVIIIMFNMIHIINVLQLY